MHLFGNADEPHLTHFMADHLDGSVVLVWDVKNTPALNWRVLRSEQDFADTPDALVGSGQTLVSESGQCGARDENANEKRTYYYTVFAQDQAGAWYRQVKAKVRPTDRICWQHPAHEGDRADGYTECGQVALDHDGGIGTLTLRNPWPLSMGLTWLR